MAFSRSSDRDKRPTFRQAADQVERQDRREAYARPAQQRDSNRPPEAYPDELLWDIATRFEMRARDNRVSLGGRNAPWIYRRLAETVDRSGMREMEFRDGHDQPVPLRLAGRALVAVFWNYAPWDGDGDVIGQFADQVMFDDCLEKMKDRWYNRRLVRKLNAVREKRASGEG
jgi:hypothetical protein